MATMKNTIIVLRSCCTHLEQEGFEEVLYEWQKEADCSSLLKSWILQLKLTQRAEVGAGVVKGSPGSPRQNQRPRGR